MFCAANDTRSQDAPPLFAGVFFLLSGFDSSNQTQLSVALEQHGGVNVGVYDESCTHIIVSRTFLWDDPVCAAARKDGKCLCTELWISDCLDLGVLQDANHVIYRPLRDSQGIFGSKNLVVCLTGYQGQARRNVMRMVHLMGAHFSKPLIANRITHLVCYKFEGEKFNLAKQLGLKLVNHQWLEDCLRTWALLSEEDYSRSGLEVELSEAEAKDSEDDGILKSTSLTPKVSSGTILACLEGAREEVQLQTQIEKVDKSVPSEQCPQEGRKSPVHLSPNYLSCKKNDMSRVGGDFQKESSNDAIVCEIQNERGEAELTSPVVLQAKRMKSRESPEMASDFKRKTPLGNGDDGGWEANNQHGGKRHSAKEAVFEMQLDGGSVCQTEKIFTLTTPARKNGDIAKMELATTKPVPKNNENGASSPPAGGTTLNVVACQEENMTSAPLSVGTSQATRGKKHSTPLGTGLDSMVSNNKGLLHSKGVTENTQKENTDEDLHMGVTETDNTPGTCGAKRIHTFVPPSSTTAKENENFLQVQCSSASKSTEVKRPPKNISARKGKAKVAQKILYMDGNSMHSSLGELSEVKLLVKRGSIPKSNVEKAGEIADQGRDLKRIGEEQKTVCINLDEHAIEMQVNESKLLDEGIGIVEAHHSGELVQHSKTGAQKSGSKTKGKLKQKSNLRSSEKVRPLTGTGEMMALDKETTAQLMAIDKRKTVNNDILMEGPIEKAEKQSMPCNERSSSNENVFKKQLKESKFLKDEDCNISAHSRGKISQPAQADGKMSGTKKQGKLSKKADKMSTKRTKLLTVEKTVLDKENAVVYQNHETTGEPKISHEAVVVRKSHEKVISPDNVSQKIKATSQRCFALSGHRQEIKSLQALVKELGGKLCRDSHQWSHQTTHLVISGQLRRTEKLFASAAGGRWILREDYLKDSSEAGVFLDEKKYEWHGPGMTKDGSISFEAPRKWREMRENTGCCALEGLRILLYGECIIPSLDTLRRAIRAGGADLVATCPPYTRFLASKVDFAIVNPGTPKTDQWIQEFLKHSVACVTTDFFVDYVCKPSSCLDRHILYDTHHLVQIVVTRLQASNMGAKRDKEGSNDGGEDCGGEEISCVTCGRSDREDVMLLCGDDKGSGCGTAMHIDCCKPPLDKVPAHDWYCVQCTKPPSPLKKRKKKAASSKG